MPHPIAHPAASIPFTRAGLVFSALVFGSLAPDFGYFIPLPGSFFMYTTLGLILFNVPMGFVLLWLFQVVVKWPFFSLLPVSLQRRLFKPAQGFSFGPLKRFLLILLSLLVGSVTHVIWDSFTHVYGWAVQQFPFLSVPINGTPLYDVLQNLGSIVGIGLLLYWFIRWFSTAPQSDQLSPRFSLKILATYFALLTVSLALIEGRIIYLRMVTGSRFIGGPFWMQSTILSAIIIVSLFVGVYSLAWRMSFQKNIQPDVRQMVQAE